MRLRREGENRILFEVTPREDASNMLGGLHGGFLSAYAEQVLGIFVVPFDLPFHTITVSLNFDYPASGRTGVLLEGEAELVRETGRMQFVRLMLSQEGLPILIGSGVLRKVPR